MKNIKVLLLMLFLVIPSFLKSDITSANMEITAKEIIEKVQSKYKTIDNITAKFSQKVKFQVSKIEQEYSGALYVKKENKYRIETDQQILITDGKTTWAYSLQNKQVVIDNYKEDKNTLSPDKFLLQYPEDYYSTLLGQEKVVNNQTYILKLTPKNDNSFIKSMKVWVDDNEWFIRKIEWSDINENVTTYIVKKIEINSKMNDDKFNFSPSKDVQVIDLR
jgi:chaperone LolA